MTVSANWLPTPELSGDGLSCCASIPISLGGILVDFLVSVGRVSYFLRMSSISSLRIGRWNSFESGKCLFKAHTAEP